jgi:nucleoside-diphosphate-sugar epimerase
VSPDRLAGRRALVTGASGFIGGSLVQRLRAEGAEVHAVSRTVRVDPDVRWHEADLADPAAVQRLVSGVQPELVFHLAGESRAARDLGLVLPTFHANLVSTVNLLAAAADTGCARVVLAGSLEAPVDGVAAASSPYAVSKWAAAVYGRMFSDLYKLPVVTLRIFMTYGPGQQDVRKLVPYVTLSLLRGERPKLTSGRREVDWVYVDDVADAHIAAALGDGLRDGGAADVGTGRLVSIRSLVEQLVEIVDPELEPEFGAVEDRASEQVRAADVEAAAATLGWRPQVSLEEGLRRTVEWYRERLGAGRP